MWHTSSPCAPLPSCARLCAAAVLLARCGSTAAQPVPNATASLTTTGGGGEGSGSDGEGPVAFWSTLSAGDRALVVVAILSTLGLCLALVCCSGIMKRRRRLARRQSSTASPDARSVPDDCEAADAPERVGADPAAAPPSEVGSEYRDAASAASAAHDPFPATPSGRKRSMSRVQTRQNSSNWANDAEAEVTKQVRQRMRERRQRADSKSGAKSPGNRRTACSVESRWSMMPPPTPKRMDDVSNTSRRMSLRSMGSYVNGRWVAATPDNLLDTPPTSSSEDEAKGKEPAGALARYFMRTCSEEPDSRRLSPTLTAGNTGFLCVRRSTFLESSRYGQSDAASADDALVASVLLAGQALGGASVRTPGRGRRGSPSPLMAFSPPATHISGATVPMDDLPASASAAKAAGGYSTVAGDAAPEDAAPASTESRPRANSASAALERWGFPTEEFRDDDEDENEDGNRNENDDSGSKGDGAMLRTDSDSSGGAARLDYGCAPVDVRMKPLESDNGLSPLAGTAPRSGVGRKFSVLMQTGGLKQNRTGSTLIAPPRARQSRSRSLLVRPGLPAAVPYTGGTLGSGRMSLGGAVRERDGTAVEGRTASHPPLVRDMSQTSLTSSVASKGLQGVATPTGVGQGLLLGGQAPQGDGSFVHGAVASPADVHVINATEVIGASLTSLPSLGARGSLQWAAGGTPDSVRALRDVSRSQLGGTPPTVPSGQPLPQRSSSRLISAGSTPTGTHVQSRTSLRGSLGPSIVGLPGPADAPGPTDPLAASDSDMQTPPSEDLRRATLLPKRASLAPGPSPIATRAASVSVLSWLAGASTTGATSTASASPPASPVRQSLTANARRDRNPLTANPKAAQSARLPVSPVEVPSAASPTRRGDSPALTSEKGSPRLRGLLRTDGRTVGAPEPRRKPSALLQPHAVPALNASDGMARVGRLESASLLLNPPLASPVANGGAERPGAALQEPGGAPASQPKMHRAANPVRKADGLSTVLPRSGSLGPRAATQPPMTTL